MPSGCVIVTGAGGFAGSHLLDAMGRAGTRVVAWHRPGEPPIHRSGPHVVWQAVDVLDRTTVRSAVRTAAPAVVVHLAGATHVGQSWADIASTLAINVIGTHVVLDAVGREAPDARVVVTGSAAVYRGGPDALDEAAPLEPSSPYALSKLAQERLALRVARDERLAVVVARPFNHIGPRQAPSFFASGFAQQIARIEAGRAAPVLRVGNLDARRDLTDVRDTVAAYLALARQGRAGEVYNVCSGRAYAIREVLDRLLALVRVTVSVELDPERLRPSDTPVLVGDPGRLTRDTGWTPAISIDRTLADILDEWRRVAADEPAATPPVA